MRIFSFAIGCLICLSLVSVPALHAQNNRLGQWQSIQSSGVTIEFQPGSEDVARQLLPVVVNWVRSFPEMGSAQHLARFNELAQNKNKALQFIATQIGLKKPGVAMSETYDGVISEMKKVSAAIPDPHRIRLWPRETLVAMLSSGQKIPGWTYDAKADKVEFEAIMGSNGLPTNRDPLPVVVANGDSVSKVIDTTDGMVVSFYTRFRDILFPAQMVYNQTTTAGISADIGLSTAFARWFCEGAASLIAWQCTNAFPGQSVDPIPPSWRDYKRYESRKPSVDLLSWRAMAWEREMPTQMDTDLSAAHTACALHEMQALVGRHGPQTISKVLTEFSKTESRDSLAMLAAIRTATGEDLRPVLTTYGSLDRDAFKGLAVRDVGISPAVKQSDDKVGTGKYSSSIPLITDGDHGLALHFVYETLILPLDAKAELVKSDGSIALSEDMKLSNTMGETIWHPMFSKDMTPGDYRLRLYFRGKLFREIPLKLISQAG